MVQACLQFLSQEGFQLLLAILLGGLVGLEREIKGKPAGLRTTILICLGSTLFMMLSEKVAMMAGPGGADPARIASGIVTGIGFLGAGSIFHGGATIDSPPPEGGGESIPAFAGMTFIVCGILFIQESIAWYFKYIFK